MHTRSPVVQPNRQLLPILYISHGDSNQDERDTEPYNHASGLTLAVLFVLGVSVIPDIYVLETAGRIERHRYDPSLELAFKLAAYLECRIKGIFQPEESMARRKIQATMGTDHT